ncbi:unnamed protein product [Ceutorhynchus assimilis]|uniref:Uncharacterized protein n=1 Tax=Ceutorhynchus assimilis TaxID=467358 RepID=A0A9P0GKP5_9CUCU|nr:unnamed protein product [Ceutorhynchus assimilis]
MILFPEEILKTQICSCCKQYLSYGPIKVSISEGVMCGRCLKDEEETAPSLLNNIIKNVIFPCVNRFDGCNELLKCEDVPQHENVCRGSLHLCPICVNHSNNQLVKYSLLSLIHHYRILHNKYYLTNPLLSVSTKSAKESNYLYCNEYKNILAFIYVEIIAGQPYVKMIALGNNKNKINCSFNCHNVIGDVAVRLSSSSTSAGEFHFKLLSAANSDNGLEKMYLELEFSQLSITTPFISLEESKVECSTVIGTKIKPEDFKYSGEPYDDFMLKCFPDFCLEYNGYKFKKIQKVTSYGKIHVLLKQSTEYQVQVICNFCENYFLLSNGFSRHGNCNINICIPCYMRGVKYCQSCSADGNCSQITSTIFKNMSNVLFYCRYHCGMGFGDNAVFDHEKTCSHNPKAGFSDFQFAEFYFGHFFIESSDKFKSIVIRHDNRVTLITSEMFFLWPHQGRIYMVTDSGFCCIIFYKIDKSDIHFSVAHKYPLDKYYTSFKIVDNENQPFREEKDSFKVNLQTKKFFFVVAPREYPTPK